MTPTDNPGLRFYAKHPRDVETLAEIKQREDRRKEVDASDWEDFQRAHEQMSKEAGALLVECRDAAIGALTNYTSEQPCRLETAERDWDAWAWLIPKNDEATSSIKFGVSAALRASPSGKAYLVLSAYPTRNDDRDRFATIVAQVELPKDEPAERPKDLEAFAKLLADRGYTHLLAAIPLETVLEQPLDTLKKTVRETYEGLGKALAASSKRATEPLRH